MKKIKISCNKCKNYLYQLDVQSYFTIMLKKDKVKKEEKNLFLMANVLAPLPFYCKKCDTFSSFYETTGRNLIGIKHVESNPVICK